MLKLNIFFLLLIIITSCKKSNKSFDEIHISTETDSSYIQLIVTNDSIIVLQLERRECKPFLGCKYGPKYYTEIIKSEQIFKSINIETQAVLEDTFQLEDFTIVDGGSTSELDFLLQDSLLKKFRYYGSESNGKDIIQIQKKLFNLINKSHRVNFNTNSKLLDVSDLKYVDSIRINKLKSVEVEGFNGKRINYIDDYELKKITSKGQIDTFVRIIINQKIIDTTEIMAFEKFIPKYEFNFYRNGLIRFELETDLRIMPYSWLQVLKIDSVLIKYFN